MHHAELSFALIFAKKDQLLFAYSSSLHRNRTTSTTGKITSKIISLLC